jgi:hypothetical protein
VPLRTDAAGQVEFFQKSGGPLMVRTFHDGGLGPCEFDVESDPRVPLLIQRLGWHAEDYPDKILYRNPTVGALEAELKALRAQA